jgi:hypothetical protein
LNADEGANRRFRTNHALNKRDEIVGKVPPLALTLARHGHDARSMWTSSTLPFEHSAAERSWAEKFVAAFAENSALGTLPLDKIPGLY